MWTLDRSCVQLELIEKWHLALQTGDLSSAALIFMYLQCKFTSEVGFLSQASFFVRLHAHMFISKGLDKWCQFFS